jgi:DNA-directed RNA polymerase sigma subunit (sigma70/sigma32)
MNQNATERFGELCLSGEQNAKIKELQKRYLSKNTADYYCELADILFGANSGLTLDEIGIVLGITRERVRQIETRALKILRSPKVSLPLRIYIDM